MGSLAESCGRTVLYCSKRKQRENIGDLIRPEY